MWRVLSVSALVAAVGVAAYVFVLSPGYEVAADRQALIGSIEGSEQLATVSRTPPVAKTVALVTADDSFNARFAGLLSHVRWLIEQDKTPMNDSDLPRINKQFESLADDVGDAVRDLEDQIDDIDIASLDSATLTTPVFSGPIGSNLALGAYYLTGDGDNEGILINSAGAVQITKALLDAGGDAGSAGYVLWSTGTSTNWVSTSSLGISGTLSNNAVIPDYLSTTGQTDEYCLTYETTGSTWEWQTCGGSLWSENGSDINFTTGNVGIGTTSPYADLAITGDVAITGGLYDSTASLGAAGMVLQTTGTGLEWVSTSSLQFRFADLIGDADDISDGVYNVFSQWEYVTGGINYNSGNAGVGSTTPTAKLTVQNTGSGNSFIVEDQANDTSPFVIDASGNVGIGTVAPTSKLHVVGEIFAENIGSFSRSAIYGYAGANPQISSQVFKGADIGASSEVGNSQNISWLTGIQAYSYHWGTGIVTNFNGAYAETGNYSTGTITNDSVIVAQAWGNDVAGGTITNLKVIDVRSISNSGTITNTYGLYLGDLTAGTQTNQAYSIYASDANTRNYLAGNTGIGSTSPSSKLTIQNTGSGNSFIVEDQANDTTPFVIDASGNVGIGVAASANDKLALLATYTSTSGFKQGISSLVFANPASASASTFYGGSFDVQTEAGNAQNFTAWLSGLYSRVGHVGTGTVDEAYGVIAETSNSSSGTITNSAAFWAGSYNDNAGGTITNQKLIEVGDITNAGTITNTYGLYLGDLTAGTQTNQAYSIYASDAGTRNYFAGKVGIGTSTPDKQLNIYAANNPEVTIRSGSTGHPNINLYGYRLNDNNPLAQIIGYNLGTDDVARIAFYRDGNDDAGAIRFATQQNGSSLAEKMRLDSYGRLGIGTTTPQQRLQVFGDIRVGTAGTNGCVEDYGGTFIAGTCSSDERLKTDILDITTEERSYLESLVALEPVTYKWNKTAAEMYGKNANVENLGLIAQNVEAVFPELISQDTKGYKQVDFRALPFYIIEAIKELWNKVSENTDRIEELETENEQLKERLNNIEQELDVSAPVYVPSANEPVVEEGEGGEAQTPEETEPEVSEPEPEPIAEVVAEGE